MLLKNTSKTPRVLPTGELIPAGSEASVASKNLAKCLKNNVFNLMMRDAILIEARPISPAAKD